MLNRGRFRPCARGLALSIMISAKDVAWLGRAPRAQRVWPKARQDGAKPPNDRRADRPLSRGRHARIALGGDRGVMATVVIGVRHNATPAPASQPTRTRAGLRCSLKMSMNGPSINMHSPARIGNACSIRPTRCPTSGDDGHGRTERKKGSWAIKTQNSLRSELGGGSSIHRRQAPCRWITRRMRCHEQGQIHHRIR